MIPPILAAAVAAALAADTTRPPAVPVEVELSHGRESVSAGPDWSETALRLAAAPRPGSSLFLQVRHVRRFGEDDAEVAAGGAAPLGGGWSAALDGAFAPAADVLPRLAAGVEAYRVLGAGWVAAYGVRGAEYPSGTVWTQRGTAERYAGAWLAGYTLTRADVPGGTAGYAHTLRGTRFYGAGSAATLGATAGREAEVVGPGDTRLLEVRSLALWGAHRVDPATALTYVLSWTRQGEVQERTGLRLGVRRRL